MSMNTDIEFLNSVLSHQTALGGSDFGGDAREVASSMAGYLALTKSPRPSDLDATGDVPEAWSAETNVDFWQSASSYADGVPVYLPEFVVTEWSPLSPGRFHTPDAAWCREHAMLTYNPERKYPLLSKVQLITTGGFGSLRLAPRVTLGQPMHIWGASSSGVCHEGIPIAIPIHLADRVAILLGQSGGVRCSIRGRIHSFPRTADNQFQYNRGVRRRYVLVEAIEARDACERDEILVTGAVLLDTRKPGWVFASFRPGNLEIGRAADWIEEYIQRYAPGAAILSDFDENADWFSGSRVELPIRELMAGRIAGGGKWSTAVVNIVNSTIGALAIGDGATACGTVEAAIKTPRGEPGSS